LKPNKLPVFSVLQYHRDYAKHFSPAVVFIVDNHRVVRIEQRIIAWYVISARKQRRIRYSCHNDLLSLLIEWGEEKY